MAANPGAADSIAMNSWGLAGDVAPKDFRAGATERVDQMFELVIQISVAPGDDLPRPEAAIVRGRRAPKIERVVRQEVCGAGSAQMPHPKSIDPESFEEERRLMYVAVTRARKRLLITYPVDGVPGSPQRPSPFLPPKFPWDELNP